MQRRTTLGAACALLAALRSVRCPGLEKTTPTDLDYLWEAGPDAVALLSQLVHGLKPDMLLTEDEVEAFAKLEAERPEDVLEGELLEKALSAAGLNDRGQGQSLAEMTSEEIEEALAAESEEVDLLQASVDNMKAVSAKLTSDAARLRSEIEDLTLVEEKAKREARRQEEKVAILETKFGQGLKELDTEIKNVGAVLQQFKNSDRAKPTYVSVFPV